MHKILAQHFSLYHISLCIPLRCIFLILTIQFHVTFLQEEPLLRISVSCYQKEILPLSRSGFRISSSAAVHACEINGFMQKLVQ